MNPSPRQWVIGGLTTIVVAGGIVVGTVRSDGNSESFADTSAVTVTSEASTSSSSSSTSSTSTSSTTTTIAPVVTAPPAPPPPPSGPAGGGVLGQCYSWPLDQINGYRAEVKQPPLSAMGNGAACNWAQHLAYIGGLAHDSSDCGYQVVGWYGSSGGAVNPNTPSSIIYNWYMSRGTPTHPIEHYEIITMANLRSMALAFVNVTYPDGSWKVFGVGNLCP